MPLSILLGSLLSTDPQRPHELDHIQSISSAQSSQSSTYDVLLTRSPNLGAPPTFNATAVLAGEQGHVIAVLTTATSCLSFTATLIAVYWFCMMRRNFRRSLVALLIVADLVKSLVLIVQSSKAMSSGGLQTNSTFCQVTGYILLTSSESCDVTIFLMSLHMVLQIFPSPRLATLGHDGLFQIRGWVYAVWFIVPNILGSLAFVGKGYATVGPICSLPIRPFWYRLALAWIPRYLMIMYICYVAFRIYRHVGKEFKVFGQVEDESHSVDMPGESSCNRADAAVAMTMQTLNTVYGHGDRPPLKVDDGIALQGLSVPRLQPVPESRKQGILKNTATDRSKMAASGSLPGSRRPSLIAWIDFSSPRAELLTRSLPNSRRGSRQGQVDGASLTTLNLATERPAVPLATYDFTRRNSATTLASLRSPGFPSHLIGIPSGKIVPDTRLSARTELFNAQKTALNLIQSRRNAIQRQLRILFIYPVVYILLWIFPFISHCLSYSDHFAQHPVFAISVLNFFCQCFLGCADVLVFSWREKPWRHIPGSDGTFQGSFLFWRFYREGSQIELAPLPPHTPTPPATYGAVRPETGTPQSQIGLIASVKHWSMNLASPTSPARPISAVPTSPSTSKHFSSLSRGTFRTTSASDRRQMELERVQERLAMEKLDDERATQGRNTSVTSSAGERREWWDSGAYSGPDLFHDDPNDDDDDHDTHDDHEAKHPSSEHPSAAEEAKSSDSRATSGVTEKSEVETLASSGPNADAEAEKG